MSPVSMRFSAWTMAFGVGFLSLSQEILWIRVVSFVQQGVPQAFAFVLALFLLGVALGAALGRRACFASRRKTLLYGVALITLAGLTDLTLPWAISTLGTHVGGVGLLAPLIVFSAALKAALFPIAHHLGSEATGSRTGRTVSRVYFMNIAGSTLGPLLTGFVLLDHFSTQAMFLLIGFLGLGLAALLLTMVWSPVWGVAGCMLSAVLATTVLDRSDHSMLRAIAEGGRDGTINRVIENRHGIVHTVQDDQLGDVVYGGNVYDGRINTDLLINSNRISRMYLLAALHPAPRRVLVIGLSGGSWTRVLSAFPSIERIDVVEINPGYLDLIRAYPAVSSILSDPRVHIHIDDGRRWLRNHPDQKFDLVVMNTSFHWRAYSTNLLAFDFLTGVRRHLSPGGVFAFNATGSIDALFTASKAFPYAYRWENFVYAAEHDLKKEIHQSGKIRLMSLPWSALSAPTKEARQGTIDQAVDAVLTTPFVGVEEAMKELRRPPEIITLQNMITEYRYGRAF